MKYDFSAVIPIDKGWADKEGHDASRFVPRPVDESVDEVAYLRKRFQLFTAAEVGQVTGFKAETIYEYVKAGRIRARRIGRIIRISSFALADFLEQEQIEANNGFAS